MEVNHHSVAMILRNEEKSEKKKENGERNFEKVSCKIDEYRLMMQLATLFGSSVKTVGPKFRGRIDAF